MSTRLLQNIVLTVVILLFGAGLVWGVVAGVRAGKSHTVLKNADAITAGLQLFYNDQNRYPTSFEFTDRLIMLDYFSVFPFTSITGGSCTNTYDYFSDTPKSYRLTFCLPKAAGGWPAGVNTVIK